MIEHQTDGGSMITTTFPPKVNWDYTEHASHYDKRADYYSDAIKDLLKAIGCAPSRSVADPPESFAGRILFVPSADPGFDWIFTRGIAGFVTQFGGANSHMAIRAGELGIPAVIGAGEALFQRWRTARKLCLDCTNQKVLVVVGQDGILRADC